MIIDVTSMGAIGDGVTDDTAAFIAAIAALPVTGGKIWMPPGNYKITSTLYFNTPIEFTGSGRACTTINYETVAGDALTFVCDNSEIHNFTLTSTIAGRTGAGILLYTGVQTAIHDIIISHQQDGIRSLIGGNDFYNIFSVLNSRHGLSLEAVNAPQNSVGCRFVQTNNNGGNGINIIGSATGLRFTNCTSVGNTNGICLENPTPSEPGVNNSVNAVWLVGCEFSANSFVGINLINNSGGVNFIIDSTFCESSGHTNLFLGNNTGVVISNCTLTGAGYSGLILQGQDIAVSNCHISGNVVAGVICNGNGISLSGIISSNKLGTQGIGIRIDGGSAIAVAGGNYSSNTLPVGGGWPAASKIRGAIGLTDV